MSNEQYLAILDLGSNSVRLKITKIQDNGSFETVQYGSIRKKIRSSCFKYGARKNAEINSRKADY